MYNLRLSAEVHVIEMVFVFFIFNCLYLN